MKRISYESVSYCNLKVEHGFVNGIRDKQRCNSGYVAFSAPLFVYDHELLFRNSSSSFNDLSIPSCFTWLLISNKSGSFCSNLSTSIR